MIETHSHAAVGSPRKVTATSRALDGHRRRHSRSARGLLSGRPLPGYLLRPVERLRRRTLATLAVFGGLVAWDSLVERVVLSRGVLLATLVFALLLPPLAETLARRMLVRRGNWGIPVVLLGSGDSGRVLARTLRREPELGLQPIAFLDNRPSSRNTLLEDIPVLGPLSMAGVLEHHA